jgi:aspartyl/asparaginyl beta-hydroxylase (cupin superfamily)
MSTALISWSTRTEVPGSNESSPDYQAVKAYLDRLGAARFGHARARSLCQHLLHTREILAHWSYPTWIRNAGALHSIYGTDTDKRQLIPLSERDSVRSFVGRRAERAIFLFCTLPRQGFLTALELHEKSRSLGNVLELLSNSGDQLERLDQSDIDALIPIHMANDAEQAQAPDGGPSIWLHRLQGLARHLSADAIRPAVFDLKSAISSRDQEEDARSWYLKGLGALKRGDHSEAADSFRFSSQLCSVWAEPTTWRAYLSLHAGDLRTARELNRQAQQQIMSVGLPWDKRLTRHEWLWLTAALGRLAADPRRQLSAGLTQRLHALMERFGNPEFPLTARQAPVTAKTISRPASLTVLKSQPAASSSLDSRFQQYIGMFANNSKNARMLHYPSLPSQPFFDPETFPMVVDLEANFPQIREEIIALDDVSFHQESEASIKRSGSWQVFMLYERGRKNQKNTETCPTVTRIIERHTTVRTLAGLIYISKMSPKTSIQAHRGPTNMRLRCHLGIQIPKGDCAIRVGDQVRHWEEGKCLVFDDYFEHEAWNHTDQLRKVLVVDIWHPDLSQNERLLLEGLHRFAMAQAESLNKYWSGNEKARKANYD